MLESLEHAQQRGATILAEFVGGAYSCDAHHMTEPTPSGEGVALCLQRWVSMPFCMQEGVYIFAYSVEETEASRDLAVLLAAALKI